MDHSGRLVYMSAQTLSKAECNRMMEDENQPKVTIKQICAYTDFAKACAGDEGSPMTLLHEPAIVIGILSHMMPDSAVCTANGLPEVYTRVASYRQWILAQLAQDRDASNGY